MGTPTQARENIQQDIDVGSKHQPLQTHRVRQIVSSLLSAGALAMPMSGFAQETGSEDPEEFRAKISALLTDCDSVSFSTREAAFKELLEHTRARLCHDPEYAPFLHDDIFRSDEYSAEQEYQIERVLSAVEDQTAWRPSRFRAPEKWKTSPPTVREVFNELERQFGKCIELFSEENTGMLIEENLDGNTYWDTFDHVLERMNATVHAGMDGSLLVGTSKDLKDARPTSLDPFVVQTQCPESTIQHHASKGSIHSVLHVNNEKEYRTNTTPKPIISATLQSEQKISIEQRTIRKIYAITSQGKKILPIHCVQISNAHCYIEFYCDTGDASSPIDIFIELSMKGHTKRYELQKDLTIEFIGITPPLERTDPLPEPAEKK